MIDNVESHLALRAHLTGLAVATTGAVTLAASAAGGFNGASAFTRATGSFLTDGLAAGMELVAAGFPTSAHNVTAAVKHVTATVCTVDVTLSTLAGAAGRSLTVGLPAAFAAENVIFDPATMPAGRPFVEEDYIPGPTAVRTVGPLATVEVDPMYVVKVYTGAGLGITAAGRYVDAILARFAAGRTFALAGGPLRVRSDHAPYAGQLVPANPGWVVRVVTVPLRLLTTNTL